MFTQLVNNINGKQPTFCKTFLEKF
jgi:hypothetical protein